jgi:hypothetical protein
LISSPFILASITLPVKALTGDYAPHPDNMGAELLPAEDDTYPAPEDRQLWGAFDNDLLKQQVRIFQLA